MCEAAHVPSAHHHHRLSCWPPPAPLQRTGVGDIDRMLGDVQDIREWDSGHLSLRYRGIDVREGVRRLLMTQAPLAAVPLRWHVDASVPRFVVVDDVRLRHILSTGLWNACKAADSGEVTLDAAVVVVPAEGGEPQRWLRFEVVDHGPAVPELPTTPVDLPTASNADMLLVGLQPSPGAGAGAGRRAASRGASNGEW